MNQEMLVALKAVVPALVAAAIVMAMAHPPWRAARATDARRGWAQPLALGAGFSASFLLVVAGWPDWPPRERWQWILPMVIGATAISMIGEIGESNFPRGWMRWLRSLLIAALAAVMAWMLHPTASVAQPWAWRIACGASVVVLIVSFESTRDPHAALSNPISMMLMLTTVSIVVLQARFATLSLLAAAAAAALGVICVILIWKRAHAPRGSSAVMAIVLAGLVFTGWFYMRGEVPAASFALPLAAPPIMRLGEMIVREKTPTHRTTWLRLALAVIVSGIAVALSMRGENPNEFDY